jgi:CMP-N-acetylneuraminic acid synthetase
MGGISIYGPGSTTIILPRHLVQDIDTEEDWSFAEILYRCLRQTEEKQ